MPKPKKHKFRCSQITYYKAPKDAPKEIIVEVDADEYDGHMDEELAADMIDDALNYTLEEMGLDCHVRAFSEELVAPQ